MEQGGEFGVSVSCCQLVLIQRNDGVLFESILDSCIP